MLRSRLRFGQGHRQPDQDHQHEVEAERERQVERRERSQLHPRGEPDVVLVEVPQRREVLVPDELLPDADQRGHETHDHEDRDEVVAFTPVEWAPPDRDADQHAEVREPQPDEGRVRVDEHADRSPSTRRAANGMTQLGNFRRSCARASGGQRKVSASRREDEHLLPRVRPGRCERLQDAVERQEDREQEDAALRSLQDGETRRDEDRQAEHPERPPEHQRHRQDDDADDEHARCREQAFARITKYGCHPAATVPVCGRKSVGRTGA